MDPEERFAERLRAFDHEAWSKLFDAHRGQVWRYASARTGSRDSADDITAQVFVEALESIHRYQYRGKPVLAWLYRIARNQTGKLLRGSKRNVALSEGALAVQAPDGRLDALALSEALRSLTPEQADAITMRFLAGYSTQEIARAMGKSASAVYSLELRGIRALRRYFGVSQEQAVAADEIWAAEGIDT